MNVDLTASSGCILLVEDNPGDVRLAKEALKESGMTSSLSVATDGAQAIAFLRRQGEYVGAPRPDLILLDLNLPRRNGAEVLAEIKQDPELRCIPVVVLSSSGAEEDVMKSYELHANCYIIKPVDLEEYVAVVQSLSRFWFSTVALPPRC